MDTIDTTGTPEAVVVRRRVGVLLGFGILLAPLLFAWVTLRQGYSVLARVVSFAWLLIGVVIFVAAAAQPQLATKKTQVPVTDASLPQPAAASAEPATPAPAAAPRLDLAVYGRIKTGMSYAAVRDIVGADGEEQSSSETVGIKTASYVWSNTDGSNMILIFQRGRLASKAQFGLR